MIDKREVLRYLGYRNQAMDDNIHEAIDECIRLTMELSRPKHISREFPLSVKNNHIEVLGTNLVLEGQSIRDYLKDAKSCILFAATLGIEIENLIRIKEKTDMTQALIIDACCTDYIEKICDDAQAKLDKPTNFRFSPGYGDLPLRIQPLLLNILNAQKAIGLTVTDSYIMIPRKSVTAVMGVTATAETGCRTGTCHRCTMKDSCNVRNT